LPVSITINGSSLRRWFLYLLGGLILLAITGTLLRRPILSALGRALVENDKVEKADCILVPGGDNHGGRILRAAELAVQGYAPYVLVDGPAGFMGHESDTTIQYALMHGLPQGLDSTAEEMRYLINGVLKRNQVKSVLLVTSNFHTRRAARILRREAPWLKVIAVAAPDPYFTADGWWKTRNGKKTFLFEWMKTIAEWRGA
jgi:uncharacterized SAM-binding protein YcdF (DUF218 family)